MRNSIGNNVVITLFGESHGPEIGVVIDGLQPGIEVNEKMIALQLEKRRPMDECDTSRHENDNFRIVSGVFNGFTTGSPISILIPNEDVCSQDYEEISNLARPGHCDYSAHIKYQGFEDRRGGGHFSGRLTAALVAAGAICRKALEEKGIFVATHILQCAGVGDAAFSTDSETLAREVDKLNSRSFPVLDAEVEEKIREAVCMARADGDSVGGIVQTAVCGLPAGVGEPWFDSLEGALSKALFSIGGIKGVEFGAGFGFAAMRGSQANDAFAMAPDGKIHTTTNNNGGINGGISNGMPVVFNCAVKPTPSISKSQKTINLNSGEETEIEIKGRHDPAIVRRICPVVSAMAAIVLCDFLNY